MLRNNQLYDVSAQLTKNINLPFYVVEVRRWLAIQKIRALILRTLINSLWPLQYFEGTESRWSQGCGREGLPVLTSPKQ